MRIPRIYLPESLTQGSQLELTDSAARHVVRVLRLKPEDMLTVFDGNNHQADARISRIVDNHVTIRVGDVVSCSLKSPLSITLAQGISRGERRDMTIQKSVELGVSHIQPLFTERCMVHLSGKRLEKRMQHWQGVVISACEQCGRNDLPVLSPPVKFGNFIENFADELGLLLSPYAGDTLQSLQLNPHSVTLLIGPEGGLSENEHLLAQEKGFRSIKMGPRVLRTETAALASITTMQVLWGDLG